MSFQTASPGYMISLGRLYQSEKNSPLYSIPMLLEFFGSYLLLGKRISP